MERSVTPLVSVLLASYNHEKYVEKAVASVMEQEGVDFELIVVDDGSQDKSPEILSALQKKYGFIYRHRPNKGLVPTMNELLSMARGKYICSLASDDMMPPGRLKNQSDFLQAHPDKPICFGQVVRMDANSHLAKSVDPRYLPGIPQVTFEDIFLGRKEVHGCTDMMETEIFRKLGGYNDEFVIEDFQMILMYLSKYSPIPVVDTVCCYYRTHDTNISNEKNWLYENTLIVLSKYQNHPLYSKAVKIWKSHWFSALAYSSKKEALKKLPYLWSFSGAFFKRFFKIFIPRFLLNR